MNLICINCPKGCHLTVTKKGDEITVTGNTCKRGETYAINELLDPKRTLTTTIFIDAKKDMCLPVITSKPISKDKQFEVIKALKGIKAKAPINRGDVIVKNILDLDVDIIASKSIVE